MMEFLQEDIELIFSTLNLQRLEYLVEIIKFMENLQLFFIMVHGEIVKEMPEIKEEVEVLIWMHSCKLQLILEKNLKVIKDTVKVYHAQ